MSLLILLFLITPPILVLIASDYLFNSTHTFKEKPVFTETANELIIIYMVLLLFAGIGCVLAGAFWWLKDGIWLTINAELVLSYLDEGNFFKELLSSEISWVGIQSLSTWYLQLNLGWSFFFTIIIFFIIAWATSDGI